MDVVHILPHSVADPNVRSSNGETTVKLYLVLEEYLDKQMAMNHLPIYAGADLFATLAWAMHSSLIFTTDYNAMSITSFPFVPW